jgi:hypothetical protein
MPQGRTVADLSNPENAVRTNPFSDTLRFLTEPEWATAAFWTLLVASVVIGVITYRRDRTWRTGQHVWMFISRLMIGAMWWQQTLWKRPPTYGGLRYWMEQLTMNAAFGGQASFVREVVLKHFTFFAPLVYSAEVATALSLMLGIFTPVGGALGFIMGLNLWLGLYRSPAEWPWTYFFLALLNGTFAVFHAGRSLGVDALLANRAVGEKRGLRRLVQLAT